MEKPTYEALERRLKELERLTGELIDHAMDSEEHEVFDLSVLSNISQALASTRELDELLAIIIDEVNKALLTEGAGVLLYDENRGDLYWRQVRDARRMLSSKSVDFHLPLDGSIAGWVYRNNEPARVNDTSKDPRYYPGLSERSGFVIRKVMQVPLCAKDKTIGVLMVMNKIGGDFSDADERLLMSMAGSIALAIENAQVYEKLKKSRDDLEMIYRASMALSSTFDLDHYLSVLLGELRTALATEAAGVLLFDEREAKLYWRAVQDDKYLLGSRSDELWVPLEGSVSGEVFQTGEPALLNDPYSHPKFFKPFEQQSGFFVRNEVIVPLNTREKAIGVLVVFNKRDGQFVADDAQLLSSLAGVVALAVENATFFEEMLKSYRELEDLNRVKSKILNHLSHELRTPLAIIRGTVVNMQRKLQDEGTKSFDRQLDRLNRQIQSLNRLEAQVESIMMTGYSWEKRYISLFLQAALDLMEVQAEYTPEIRRASSIIHQWLEKTFPARKDEPERINIREFSAEVEGFIRSKSEEVGRRVRLEFNLCDSAELLIPRHVLKAIFEGLVRNAIEATPDTGLVTVTGGAKGDRYILNVRDTGMGIPDKDKEFIFAGFYPVQDTLDYCSGKPYSFNAGGKGIDLLRIRMFSELYGFRLSFNSRRCLQFDAAPDSLPGDVSRCPHCQAPEDCERNSGSEFIVDFPLADSKAAAELYQNTAHDS
jgi:K+-sensing histidine kinase KdpD